MIYTAYYTKDTRYEVIAKEQLIPSLKRWDLSYRVERIPSLGDWYKNTNYKISHVLKMLKRFKQPIVMLDVDVTIEKYPILFDEIDNSYDIGFHYLDWFLQWRGYEGDRKELLSGTMWFNYNPKVLQLLEEIKAEICKYPEIWEQKTIQKVIESHDDLKIFELPYEYASVVMHNNKVPEHVSMEGVVILHHQASRKDKSKKDRTTHLELEQWIKQIEDNQEVTKELLNKIKNRLKKL